MRCEAETKTPPPLAGGGGGEGAGRRPTILAYARTLRRDQTPAEKRIWTGLRRQQLAGLKFRRQVPLGRYIADFYCAAAKLVIELDGISHIASVSDDTRDAWMRGQGITVLRFSNYEALSNPEGVLLAIGQVAMDLIGPLKNSLSPCGSGLGGGGTANLVEPSLASPPPPSPLPQGEGESCMPPPAVPAWLPSPLPQGEGESCISLARVSRHV